MLRPRKSVFFFLFVAILTPFLINVTQKNACTSYFDYLLINFGGSCFYNPDVDLSVPQIIKKYTGNVQIYNVTTEDGYILQMFRISQKNPIGVVLLQPPISTGSIAYLSDGGHSLGFRLWKKGYDVWLSNHRGTLYSRQHVNFSETQSEFWNYGFHEIAMYDLEAQFNVITKETNSKIIYIGYSMASTAGLIYASLKPHHADKCIQSFVLIAPLANLQYLSSPFKYIFYALNFFNGFFQPHEGEFFTAEIVRWLAKDITLVPYIINIMTSAIMGWTPTEMDPVLYPYIFAHHGRGISNQMVSHYGQMFANGTDFVMYDYGKNINQIKYGSVNPPHYPLEKVNNSVYIIYGDKDKVATRSDVEILYDKLLPDDVTSGLFAIENHNHIDFMFSKHRRNKTYSTVFRILDKIQAERKNTKREKTSNLEFKNKT